MFAVSHLVGFGDLGIRPSTDIITNHTSSTSASGTASASGDAGAGFEAWRAFDGLTTSADHWASNTTTGWLRYQFTVSKVITQYKITGPIVGYGTNRAPKDWTFQGSQDASTWVTLDTQTGITGWTSLEVKTYNITNLDNYLYYRMDCTANDGGINLMTAEMRLFGY